MKKIILVVIALITIALDVRAKYFEEGVVRTYCVYLSNDYNDDYYMEDTIDGDTIIDGVNCKKIKHTERLEPPRIWWTYEYEDSGRVYRYYNDDLFETPGFKRILDFNLQPGDIFELTELYDETYIVSWVRYYTIKNVRRKFIGIKPDDFPYGIFIIEDIGFPGYEYFGNFTGNGAQRQLFQCIQDGTCIYDAREISLESLKSAIVDSDESAPLYDMMGRRVEHPQRGSLYIRNGEKLIWWE